MADLEEKLGSILNDPKMMQQIMSMAQAMGGQQGAPPSSPPPQTPPPPPENPFGNIDMATIQKISGFAQSSNIDKRERALLQALAGYLSKDRVNKLEKAMRAAKIAKMASGALSHGGSPTPSGR